tara:strand:- start:16 stop:483 length:468 start_codon:yes stop_codon:yes gene_type:complete
MIDISIFLTLLLLGYVVGQTIEKHHYRSIIDREARYKTLPEVATKILPSQQFVQHRGTLVTGNVVISVDFFKKFVAGLRSLVGGQMASYETLIDRARREAILRMKQEAAKLTAEIIFNVKLETSSIYKGRGNSIGSVEVIAYGTALIPPSNRETS